MRTKLALAMAGMVACMAATPAAALDLFVFGDSLVDSGNADAALRATGQATRTPPPYFQNRFSNGYNFADVVSTGLAQGPSQAYGYPLTSPRAPGVAPTAYFYGGNNFSYGGAQTRDEGHGTPGHSPSFQDQLGIFAASGKTIGSDDFVLLTFGGNDIQQELLKKIADPNYNPDFSATNTALQNGITALIAAGARNIIVTGQADVGKIPRITENGSASLNQLGTFLSNQLNESFRSIASTADGQPIPGLDVEFFDLFALNQAIIANPSSFGYTNVTQPCLNEATGALANPTCEGYLYFDRIHPTALAHQQIGDAILRQINAAALVPEPATWGMMILGFGLVGAAARRRKPAEALAA